MNSKLQIISGTFRGRKLKLPPTARPTQNRARIAIFNMLNAYIVPTAEMHIWDAFAGSGAFGLECLSRYPNATVLFTDVAGESMRTVRDNLKMLNVGTRAKTEIVDAMNVIKKHAATADIIFLDPPYAESKSGIAFAKHFARIAKPNALLIWEQDDSESVLPSLPDIDVLRDRKYGRARFLILQKK